MDWLLGSWHAILRPHAVRTLCCSLGRYHAKRAMYLAHLAAALKGQEGVDHITLNTLCNDPRWGGFPRGTPRH